MQNEDAKNDSVHAAGKMLYSTLEPFTLHIMLKLKNIETSLDHVIIYCVA